MLSMALRTKNYAEIAKAKITSPSQMKNRKPPRFLIYSRNKKGKTYFGASAPNVLIADPEHGTDQMLKIDPKVWHIENWEDIDELYRFLKLGKHPYEWVVLDGMTRMHNMALRWIMGYMEERELDRKPGLVQQRDYGKAGEMTKGMIHNFHSLDMGIIFTAQERMEAGFGGDEDEESEEVTAQYVPDLPKGARASLNGIVDVIGRMYIVRAEKEVKLRSGDTETRMVPQRRLWIEPSPQYDTGYRSDYKMPRYVKEPTVSALVNLIQTGRQ